MRRRISLARAFGIALALVAMLASTALAAPPPGRGGPPEGRGPPAGVGPDRPTPISPVGVSVADADATEGSSVVFTISLDQVASADVTVEYATSDGTATAGIHYTSAAGQAVVAAGSQEATVAVSTVDDGVDNVDRTFSFDLTAVSNNGTLTEPSATGTIVDDDEPPVGATPTVDVGDVSVTEGEVAVFPVTLSGPASTDVVLTYSTTDGTASSADGTATTAKDYEPAVDALVTILAGATTGSIEVATLDDPFLGGPDTDGYDEPDETFTVEVTALTGDATLGDAVGVATILDDDDPPVLTLLSRSVSESAGSASVSIDVFGRSSEAITVDWSAGSEATDTATEDTDYTPSSGTAEIPAGFTTGVITGIPLLDDDVIEEAETFTVTISNVSSNASIATDGDVATITITDDDGTLDCASVDTHEDGNDTRAGAVPLLERPEPEVPSGESSYACQGDHDWWVVHLEAPAPGSEVLLHVDGAALGDVGDLVITAEFVPFDTAITPTPLTPEGGSDGWTIPHFSDGTPGQVFMDVLLPGSAPDLGIRYVAAYSSFSEPEG